MTETPAGPLKRTPLYTLHRALGARIVPFAGYEMPVQYPTGILAEHAQTRTAAGLFDVSHMGQVRLTAKACHNEQLNHFQRILGLYHSNPQKCVPEFIF